MPVSLAATAATSIPGSLFHIATVNINDNSQTAMGFSNIPQIYRDLFCVIRSRRTDAVTEGTQFLYTGYAGAICSTTKLYSDGASLVSTRVSAQNAGFIGAYPGASATAGVYAVQLVHIFNYSNTNTFKTVLCRTATDRIGAGQTELSVTLFRDTTALTSFGVSTFSNNVFYAPGSVATLYGVRAGA